MSESSATRITLATFSRTSFSRYASTDVDEVLSRVDRDANTLIHVVHAGVTSSTKIFECFGMPRNLVEQIGNETAPVLGISSGRYLLKRFHFIEEAPEPIELRDPTKPGALIRGAETDRFVEGAGCFILGERYLLLLEEGDASPLIGRALESVLQREQDLRERDTVYLLHRLAKALLVDNYSRLMRRLLARLQELEEPLLEGSADPKIYREVARLRRELNPFERSLLQVAEFTSEMAAEASTVQESLRYAAATLDADRGRLEKEFSMLRDRTSELIETYRDNVNTQLNNIMRSLTVLSVLFLPLSFIAGFYGMNFPNMPAFRWAGGFPLAVLLMLAILVGSLTYARRKKWL